MVWLLLLAQQMQKSLVKLDVEALLMKEYLHQSNPDLWHCTTIVQSLTNMAVELLSHRYLF